MPHPTLLRAHSALADVSPAILSLGDSEALAPCIEPSLPVQPFQEDSPLLSQASELNRFQRVGEWLARHNNSGRLNFLMWGVSTWPGVGATYTQMLLLGARTLGTYTSVRQAGFTGVRALVMTGDWTIRGFTCPVSSEYEESLLPKASPVEVLPTPQGSRDVSIDILAALALRRSAGIG